VQTIESYSVPIVWVFGENKILGINCVMCGGEGGSRGLKYRIYKSWYENLPSKGSKKKMVKE
jgi:hypothetical protein